jgi:hypothetical protein
VCSLLESALRVLQDTALPFSGCPLAGPQTHPTSTNNLAPLLTEYSVFCAAAACLALPATPLMARPCSSAQQPAVSVQLRLLPNSPACLGFRYPTLLSQWPEGVVPCLVLFAARVLTVCSCCAVLCSCACRLLPEGSRPGGSLPQGRVEVWCGPQRQLVSCLFLSVLHPVTCDRCPVDLVAPVKPARALRRTQTEQQLLFPPLPPLTTRSLPLTLFLSPPAAPSAPLV